MKQQTTLVLLVGRVNMVQDLQDISITSCANPTGISDSNVAFTIVIKNKFATYSIRSANTKGTKYHYYSLQVLQEQVQV
jgi:hypothetical protein